VRAHPSKLAIGTEEASVSTYHAHAHAHALASGAALLGHLAVSPCPCGRVGSGHLVPELVPVPSVPDPGSPAAAVEPWHDGNGILHSTVAPATKHVAKCIHRQCFSIPGFLLRPATVPLPLPRTGWAHGRHHLGFVPFPVSCFLSAVCSLLFAVCCLLTLLPGQSEATSIQLRP
jgi:hypothetical protein